MKQRIPLTEYNINLLITKYQADPDKLTFDYWIKFVVSDAEQMQKVFRNPSNKDIQIKIGKRARRLLRHYIRETLNLPKLSGSLQRQREYNRKLAKTGIKLRN